MIGSEVDSRPTEDSFMFSDDDDERERELSARRRRIRRRAMWVVVAKTPQAKVGAHPYCYCSLLPSTLSELCCDLWLLLTLVQLLRRLSLSLLPTTCKTANGESSKLGSPCPLVCFVCLLVLFGLGRINKSSVFLNNPKHRQIIYLGTTRIDFKRMRIRRIVYKSESFIHMNVIPISTRSVSIYFDINGFNKMWRTSSSK